MSKGESSINMEENRLWEAKWIWPKERVRTSTDGKHELVYFRREFLVPKGKNSRLIVDVSADSRYRLYLNGESVSVGPCKGDNHKHHYENVDLTDKLKPGKNVLAAKVLHYTYTNPWKMGESGPLSIWRAGCGGFLLEGVLLDDENHRLETLHTDERWKCIADQGFSIIPSEYIQWLGGLEQIDGSYIPHGWQKIDFDDSSWSKAVPFLDTHDDYGQLTTWQLFHRPIPQLYETPIPFKHVMRMEGAEPTDLSSVIETYNTNASSGSLTVMPGGRMVAEIDAGELATGYLELAMSGGKGGSIRILCAECYEPEHSGKREERVKGIRDQSDGGKLIGDYDCYSLAGVGSPSSPEIYEPFWFRTFRFVRIEIQAGDHPLTIHSFGYRDTGYPLQVESEFECSDTDLNKLWELSIRTLKRCMHETYEDCPYYEQLQYTMDTRLQMVFTYHLTTDDKLARRAIHDYHSSLLPTGMLQCRYPSVQNQVIPSFSIYWIYMLQDHYKHFGDMELLRRYRPTVLALVDWFDRMLTDIGIVGVTTPVYWTHFDWVDEWPGGAPPSKKDGPLSLHSLMYATGLQQAAEIMKITGWKDVSDDLLGRAQRLNEAVNRVFWSEERKLYRNHPTADDFSQHAQVWAVLSGAIRGKDAAELLQRTLSDASLPVLSLPATYNLFLALEATGLYEELAFERWDRWRAYIGLNLTTLPEKAHGTPRSDCHAWSALPLVEFPRAHLGVLPEDPGFNRIRIRPRMGGLTWAKGSVATPVGVVHVSWRQENGQFNMDVDTPINVPVIVECPDGRIFNNEKGGSFQI